MWKVASTVLVLVLSLVLVDSLSAQQRGRGQGPGRRGPGAMTMIDRVERNRNLNLTDDQKAKLAELKKAYAPKLKAAHEKFDNVLTAEQKKAREDAMKEATDAKKSRREVFQAGMAAVKFTDEQKAKRAEALKGIEALNKEISDKVTKLLTPEQQEILKKAREARGNRGGEGRRRPAPETN
jgi:Spy/CpxP family protein refolding chaperone